MIDEGKPYVYRFRVPFDRLRSFEGPSLPAQPMTAGKSWWMIWCLERPGAAAAVAASPKRDAPLPKVCRLPVRR